jgi:RNA polymerase sigma factor (sigma-70 family)
VAAFRVIGSEKGQTIVKFEERVWIFRSGEYMGTLKFCERANKVLVECGLEFSIIKDILDALGWYEQNQDKLPRIQGAEYMALPGQKTKPPFLVGRIMDGWTVAMIEECEKGMAKLDQLVKQETNLVAVRHMKRMKANLKACVDQLGQVMSTSKANKGARLALVDPQVLAETVENTDEINNNDKKVANYVEMLAKRCKLSRREWEVFKLHHAQMMTLDEIAEILGIDRRTVWTHLERGRKKFKSLTGTDVRYNMNAEASPKALSHI